MITEDVLSAEKYADKNYDATEQKHEEVREIKLHNRFVFADDAHDWWLGGDGGHVRWFWKKWLKICVGSC